MPAATSSASADRPAPESLPDRAAPTRSVSIQASALLFVFAASFAARLLGAWLVRRCLPGLVVPPDASSFYLPIARSLAHGQGFQVDGSFLEASHIAPLLPLWLAGLIRLSGSDTPLLLIGIGNALLRAVGCVFLYVTAHRCFGARAALWTTILYTIDPWETLWVGLVLKESVGVPLLLASVWLLQRMGQRPRAGTAAAAGLAIGAATLARFPSGVLLAAGLWLLLRSVGPKKRLLGLGGALAAGMLAALSPWLVRNWVVTGQPVLSTHFVGRKLYTSNGPGIQPVTNGYYDPAGIDRSLIPAPGEERGQTLQQEGRFARLTLRHLLTHPGELPARLAAKVVNMWRPTFEEHSGRNLLLLAVPYCLLMAVSLGGVAQAARRRVPCLSIAAPLLVFVCIHLVFWGEIRNRQYLTPLLYCFGGLALGSLPPRCSRAALSAGSDG